MHAGTKVQDILTRTILEWEVITADELRSGTEVTGAKLWKDRNLVLSLVAAERVYSDQTVKAEVESILNEVQKICLEFTPCIRRMMNGKTDTAVLECVRSGYGGLVDKLKEACDFLSPELAIYCAVKLDS